MIKNYLLDTCFILELYKRNPEVLAMIDEQQIEVEQCAMSAVSRIEVLSCSGLTPIDESGLSKLLQNFDSLSLSDKVAQEAISIRKSQQISIPDALILATANVHGLKLLTFRNVSSC